MGTAWDQGKGSIKDEKDLPRVSEITTLVRGEREALKKRPAQKQGPTVQTNVLCN